MRIKHILPLPPWSDDQLDAQFFEVLIIVGKLSVSLYCFLSQQLYNDATIQGTSWRCRLKMLIKAQQKRSLIEVDDSD